MFISPRSFLRCVFVSCAALALSGCWLVAGGVGAEAGYVAAQDERTAGQTVDDQLIVSKVKTAMLSDPNVPGLKINVDSFKGVVTLRGYVDNPSQADQAVQIARNTTGVESVVSKLVIE